MCTGQNQGGNFRIAAFDRTKGGLVVVVVLKKESVCKRELRRKRACVDPQNEERMDKRARMHACTRARKDLFFARSVATFRSEGATSGAKRVVGVVLKKKRLTFFCVHQTQRQMGSHVVLEKKGRRERGPPAYCPVPTSNDVFPPVPPFLPCAATAMISSRRCSGAGSAPLQPPA